MRKNKGRIQNAEVRRKSRTEVDLLKNEEAICFQATLLHNGFTIFNPKSDSCIPDFERILQ